MSRKVERCPRCGLVFHAPEWIIADVFLKWINPYLIRRKYKGDKAYTMHLNGVPLVSDDHHGRIIRNLQTGRQAKIRRTTAEALLERVGLDPKVLILVKK